jgi:hypothetical protein
VTVTAPDITFSPSAVTVGRDLQEAVVIFLEDAPPCPAPPCPGVNVVVTVGSTAVATISQDAALEGGQTVTFAGVTSTRVGTFYIQGRAEGGTTLTAQAAGHNDGVANVTVVPSGFEFATASFTTGASSANTPVTIRARRLDPVTLNVSGAAQEVRGGLTVQMALASSDTNVGTLTSPLTISGGQSQANASFDPIGAGTTALSLTQPAGFSVPSNGSQRITATVLE